MLDFNWSVFRSQIVFLFVVVFVVNCICFDEMVTQGWVLIYCGGKNTMHELISIYIYCQYSY